MKSVVTSFSMKIHEAAIINEATRSVSNRSAWIVDACIKKAKAQDSFDVSDVETRTLMIHLRHRDDVSDELKLLLEQALYRNTE